MSEINTAESGLEKLDELIQAIEVAMLTTIDEQSGLRSRPMQTRLRHFDGRLWFFTATDSPKVAEVLRNENVNLSYADPQNDHYVSITGRAQINRDRERIEALWSPDDVQWFPEGLNDPRLALLEIDVERAECWDAASKQMVALVEKVQALASDSPGSANVDARVELDSKPATEREAA